MKKHVLASMVAAATMGVLTPLTSHAFGLGKINVMSALNEPFKAEIDVNALRPEEKDNLQVKMASQAEFDRAGLSHSMLLNQMQFDIVERSGQHKILITSKQAIKEPFLDFLVTATAGSGIMLREYTVLLDPPEFVLAETRPASSRPAPAQTAPVETSSPTTTRYQYAESSGFSGSSYKVKRSDTLWNVALHTRPSDDVTVHQMMMALLKRNPSAFTNENVNGLKAGTTLQIPSRSEIDSLSQSAARQAFAAQNEAWKNRNRSTVTQVTEAAPESVMPTDEAAPADSAETAAAAEATTTPQTAETDVAIADEARLQLVAPEDEASKAQDASPNLQGNNELTKLTEQLTLAQETIEAQAQENIDLQQRMALLEEQIETMRRMISLEDTDLARMQDMLEDDNTASAAESTDNLQQAEQTADVSEADAEAQQIENVEAAASTESVEQSGDDVVAETNEVSPAEDGANSVVSKAAQMLNLDEAQVQSTIDKVKQFVADNKLPTVLGLLLVLLVLWLIARRSNREVTWDEAVKKIDKEDNNQAAAVMVTPEVVEELADAPGSAEDTTEAKTAAELVEQADMFVGYADYVQAKSSLEQARALEPANTLVAYKTLFVLYKLNQSNEFVELAEQADFEKDSFEWSEIRQWGKTLAPGHALFSEQTPVLADDDNSSNDLAFDELEPAAELDAEASSDEATLDLDADVADSAEQEAGHIEFNLDDFATSSAAEVSVDTEELSEPISSNKVDDDLLSFDTNFSTIESKADETVNIDDSDPDDNSLSFDDENKQVVEVDSFDLDAVESPADSDTPDLEFDIGDLDDIDEAETKLDLAAAYIDMGDPDGARSILNEVLVEGSDEQKNRAHELLESLA